MNPNTVDAELGAMMKMCFGVQDMVTGDLINPTDTMMTELELDTAQGSDKKN